MKLGSAIALDPKRYGHQLVNDDFWILAGRWNTYCEKIARERVHAKLGWSQGPIRPENPLGLIPSTTDRLKKDGRNKCLFYGDSYVDGQAKEENWLPPLLQSHLTDMEVLHLGVGGYGTDQMHLMMRETLPIVDHAKLILMGVEPFSFDRAGLRVRSYQKPILRVTPDEGLQVANTPIDPDPERFFANAPLSFWSFARAERDQQRTPPESHDHSFESKLAVNRAILDANQRLAKDAGADLLYVIFRDQPQIEGAHSRIQFFQEELGARGIQMFDTGPTLQAYAKEAGTNGSELYRNGHFNDEGNQLIAEALATHLKSLSLAV